MKIIDKPCERCETIMEQVISTRRFCSSCQRDKALEKRDQVLHDKRSYRRGPVECELCGHDAYPTKTGAALCTNCQEFKSEELAPVKALLPNGKGNPEYYRRLKERRKQQSEYKSDPAHGSGFF